MIRNKDIWEKLEKIEDHVQTFLSIAESMDNLDERIRYALSEESFESKMSILNEYFKDIAENTRNNLKRVEFMTAELKGVVCMSRAALNEGKNFTEMLELSNLLTTFSQDYAALRSDLIKLEKLVLHLTLYGDKINNTNG